jgi:hypothetical protein
MKVIVISGASSHVGKTTVARNLQALLEGATLVKIGHGRFDPEIKNHFYPLGTPFETIRTGHAEADWLLIESNAVLREIRPDLTIYLEGENPKPSAEYARSRADIVSGQHVDRKKVARLAARLGVPASLVRTMVRICGGAKANQNVNGKEQKCGSHRRLAAIPPFLIFDT